MNKWLLCGVTAALAAGLLLAGCTPPGGPSGGGALDAGLRYPDHGYATDDKDSWLQTEGEDDIEIEWYVDSASFALSQKVAEAVKRATGVTIAFSYPANDSGDKLSTMIAGNMLPDVITITDTATKGQLEEEGYLYSLNRLAEKYAPSLLSRIKESEWNYYKASDGNLYTLANNFYTDEEVEEYTSQGNVLHANGNFNLRKDYLYAYLEYKYGAKPTNEDFFTNTYAEVMKPDGFVEMCKWVKNHYNIANNVPMAVIDTFTLNRLAEYFSVPVEDKDGNLLYRYEQPEAKEVYMFLNTLYRENILISGALSAVNNTINGYISQGLPFFSMLTSQNFINAFTTAHKAGIDYVPICLTNSRGDAPLLRNLAGYGYRMSMITKNCAHPDRVIKVFDYLMSEEFTRELYYGQEGETFEYLVRPGETKDGVTYEWGQIKYTDEVRAAILANSYGQYNIRVQGPFHDPMYARLTASTPEECVTFNNYLLYNLKAPIAIYCYNASVIDYTMDTSASNYNRMLNLKSTLQTLWDNNFASIITQNTAEKASNEYDRILASARDYGLETFKEYTNNSFKAYKERLGLGKCVWPKNLESYEEPTPRLFGDVSMLIEIPADVAASI